LFILQEDLAEDVSLDEGVDVPAAVAAEPAVIANVGEKSR
jgi:hypothetical protein